MKDDLEPGPRPGDAGRRGTTGAAGTPWGIYVAVLVGVVVLVAVGMARVLSMGVDGADRSVPAPVASAVDQTVAPDTASWSPEPRHVFLADIAAVRSADREVIGPAQEHPAGSQRAPLPCVTHRCGDRLR